MSSLSFTHHGPIGAWSSLVFSAPNRGAAICHESPHPVENADLLIAVSRGPGRTSCLPFSANPLPANWRAAENVSRTLTPCLDTFSADLESATLTFRVHTPHIALPNPKRARSLQYATAPGLLIEITLDNSNSDDPATAFFGLSWLGEGLMRPMDWASQPLCGVAVANRWALSALKTNDQAFTICGANFAAALECAQPEIRTDANTGGIAFKVPPRSSKTVLFSFVFHHSGLATYGIDGRYLFGGYFSRIENAATFLLSAADRIKESSLTLDARLTAGADPLRAAILSHAVRQYDAATQLVDTGTDPTPTPYFTLLTGPHAWRNAIDAAIDHLPWELFRNPWVVRNIFDLFTANYSYADQLIFPNDPDIRDGGMALCHDMGAGVSYSPATTSAAECTNAAGPSGYLTTESVLSAIYLLTSYALTADDTPWSRTRLPFARELLSSMEARDHHDPEQRTGLLKATSILCGPKGKESTTFAPVDDLLGKAQGSVYLAMKSFCANILLTTYFQNNNDLHSADYSYAMAQKTATSLAAAFDESRSAFPINLEIPTADLTLAILEPLAVPGYLGLTSTLAEYFPSLMEKLKRHALSCLKPGVCLDPATGALKLASHFPAGAKLPGKLAAALYVIENLLQIDLPTEAPRALASLLTEISSTSSTPDSRTISALYLLRPLLVESEPQPSEEPA